MVSVRGRVGLRRGRRAAEAVEERAEQIVVAISAWAREGKHGLLPGSSESALRSELRPVRRLGRPRMVAEPVAMSWLTSQSRSPSCAAR